MAGRFTVCGCGGCSGALVDGLCIRAQCDLSPRGLKDPPQMLQVTLSSAGPLHLLSWAAQGYLFGLEYPEVALDEALLIPCTIAAVESERERVSCAPCFSLLQPERECVLGVRYDAAEQLGAMTINQLRDLIDVVLKPRCLWTHAYDLEGMFLDLGHLSFWALGD